MCIIQQWRNKAFLQIENNKRKSIKFLLIINDGASNYYYFAVKNLPELNSSEWLRRRKEIIINGYNTFQKALDDALNYQNIETHSERISKIKSYVIKYNWKGIEFPVEKIWIK